MHCEDARRRGSVKASEGRFIVINWGFAPVEIVQNYLQQIFLKN